MFQQFFSFVIQFSRCNLIKVVGGAKRDRTADLLLARQALSQLSYGPEYMDVRMSALSHRCGSF